MRRSLYNFIVELLLDLASAITLGSKSRRTWDHILLPHLRLASFSLPFSSLYGTQIIYKDSVRTSLETVDISAIEPNRLILFGETVAVYCKNRTEHRHAVWAECRVLQYVQIQTVPHSYRAQPGNAVWGNSHCLLLEPYRTHRCTVGTPYLTGNTSRLHYRAQPVNVVWRNSRYLLWEPYGTHRYTVGTPYLTGNTSRLHYRAQPVNAVWGDSRYLMCESHREHTDTLCGQKVLNQVIYNNRWIYIVNSCVLFTCCWSAALTSCKRIALQMERTSARFERPENFRQRLCERTVNWYRHSIASQEITYILSHILWAVSYIPHSRNLYLPSVFSCANVWRYESKMVYNMPHVGEAHDDSSTVTGRAASPPTRLATLDGYAVSPRLMSPPSARKRRSLSEATLPPA
jgi:hypothetical protein